MKRCCFLVLLAFAAGGLFAADWSGVLDSSVNYMMGAGDAADHSFGFEQYTNLRLRVRTREKATFNAAFNLIAMAGAYALPAVTSGFAISGENYAAVIELERLYFRVNGDHIDTEAGLLRMNFGYGQVWGSSDFLNPRNPLFPNARPRGVLGVNAALYPSDTLQIRAFVATPKNPMDFDGSGIIPGFILDRHWSRASLQALYAYETKGFAETVPAGTDQGFHRYGLSLKADLELGFVLDALYIFYPDNVDIDRLSLGAGFDYSFLEGNLYVLAEYLYNGASSVSALGFGGSWINQHYLYGTILYRFNDYFSMSLSTLFCFDDLSFQPILNVDYELFQGLSLNITARLPLDQKTLNDGKTGELGPIPPLPGGAEGMAGAKFIITGGVKLRF